MYSAILSSGRICCCEHGRIVARYFSTSLTLERNRVLSRGKPMFIHRWREDRDIPPTGNEYGPLTDLPDWRYPDGTPGPMSRGQHERLLKSEEYARRSVFLTQEIDSAITTHAQMERQRHAERETIIQNKLRAKNERLRGMFAPLKVTKHDPKNSPV